MSIEENMAIAARRGEKRGLSWGITHQERDTYREMLKALDLGLEDRLTSKVGLLSGGQRQAITLLMASIKKPKLLLLDEHTAALDPKTAAKVLEISDKIIAENHLTAMMVTHNMKDAIVHGNRPDHDARWKSDLKYLRRREKETERSKIYFISLKRSAAKNSPMIKHCYPDMQIC